MLAYTNNNWTWNGAKYSSFRDAMCAMCEDVTWEGSTPGVGQVDLRGLSSTEQAQLLLLHGIYDGELAAIITSENINMFERQTGGRTDKLLAQIGKNPLYSKLYSVPMGYESNMAMQSAIIPELLQKRKEMSNRVQMKHGKYPYEIALSLICDYVLFNPKTTPFKKAIDMYIVLDKHPQTKGLEKFIRHEDLHKAYILSLQAEAGDLTSDEMIMVGDLRSARYPCKTVEELYGKNDYAELMMALPPALRSNDYYTWLESAVMAEGGTLKKEAPKRRESAPTAKVENVSMYKHTEKPVQVVQQPATQTPTEVVTETTREAKVEVHIDAKATAERILKRKIPNDTWERMKVTHKGFTQSPTAYENNVQELAAIGKWVEEVSKPITGTPMEQAATVLGMQITSDMWNKLKMAYPDFTKNPADASNSLVVDIKVWLKETKIERKTSSSAPEQPQVDNELENKKYVEQLLRRGLPDNVWEQMKTEFSDFTTNPKQYSRDVAKITKVKLWLKNLPADESDKSNMKKASTVLGVTLTTDLWNVIKTKWPGFAKNPVSESSTLIGEIKEWIRAYRNKVTSAPAPLQISAPVNAGEQELTDQERLRAAEDVLKTQLSPAVWENMKVAWHEFSINPGKYRGTIVIKLVNEWLKEQISGQDILERVSKILGQNISSTRWEQMKQAFPEFVYKMEKYEDIALVIDWLLDAQRSEAAELLDYLVDRDAWRIIAKEWGAFADDPLNNIKYVPVIKEWVVGYYEASNVPELTALAKDYCDGAWVKFEDMVKELRRKGMCNYEDIYRALPIHMRREGLGVDSKRLTKYCEVLEKYYKDCTLKMLDGKSLWIGRHLKNV